jgi:hypothetical protein
MSCSAEPSAARAKRIKSLFVDRIDGESSITGWNRHVSPGLSIKCISPCAGGLRIYGRPTREVRVQACSCRSPATTPPISKCRTRKYTFGVVKAAQARGDFEVLAERDRFDVAQGRRSTGARVSE